ncbi:phage virion morphogenesis protein [Cypionkella psychrotolerans]|uniref:phage virion morphogenesis protein n=1 Tax=Cypionkella psychrotolerans TaxID=1678131 RepID=UPI0006B54742|nr:phage virion morphogenesis protein [Cypionkella psychrotolerans]
MITIEINDAQVVAALDRLSARMADMSPIMSEIGEVLVNSTTRRFGEGVSPEGVKWAAKSPVTLAAYGARKSNRIDVRPLFGPSGTLNSTISAEHGSDYVQVGSGRVYAAMMQFGGSKASYPNLWGDIPARPFLGLSDDDEIEILEIISDAFTSALSD